MNYTPKEMAVFLRRCANRICDDSCPWCDVPVDCEEQMMKDAAELLEDCDQQLQTAAKLKKDQDEDQRRGLGILLEGACMDKLTPNQVVDALRKCACTDECHGCPYVDDRGFPLDRCMSLAMEAAANAVETLQSKVPRWISVEERLPDKDLEEYHEKYGLFPFRVLVVIEGAVIPTSLIYDGEDFLDEDGEPYRVVKWMPMPEN